MKWQQRHKDGLNTDRDMAYSLKCKMTIFETQTRGIRTPLKRALTVTDISALLTLKANWFNTLTKNTLVWACSSYITGLFVIFRVTDCECDPCTPTYDMDSLHVCTFCQQEKSSSSVKLPNIEKTSARGGNSENERFKARNWKVLSKKEIQKLPPQQRSKYLAVRHLFYT